MRGRPPKPTALRRLEGNPGHRPLNQHEPQPPRTPALFEDVPPQLLADAEATAAWREQAPPLFASRMVTDVDRPLLVHYCSWLGEFDRADKTLQKSPRVFQTATGYPVLNPAVSLKRTATLLALRLASELGCTPAARARLRLDGSADPHDPFAEFFESTTDDADTDAAPN